MELFFLLFIIYLNVKSIFDLKYFIAVGKNK